MKRVFIGFENTAGIGTRLRSGFSQAGIEADFYSFGSHPFGYRDDKIIKYSKRKILRSFQKLFYLLYFFFRYRYFIYISTSSSLLKNRLELKLYKKFGKKSMVIFTGCDVRMPEKVAELKWNTCSDCTEEYKSFVGCVIDNKKNIIPDCESVFDIIACPDECAGYLRRKYYNTFFPLDIKELKKRNQKDYMLNKRLRILHAPTNPEYKGTPYIIKTVEKLKQKYDFEFVIIRNVTIEKLYEEIQSSDLVIDSVIGGFYGLLTLEALTMSRPVMGFIRQELPVWQIIKDYCPVINITPDTLYDTLERIIQKPEILITHSQRAFHYVEKYHDAKKIATDYYKLLNSL